MKLSLLALALSLATSLATVPFTDQDWRALQERAATAEQRCKARLKKEHRTTVRFSKRDLEDALDAEEELEVEAVKRGKPSMQRNYHCGTIGHLTNAATPVGTETGVSNQACADYCICTQGKSVCHGYTWTPDDPSEGTSGLGSCTTYAKGFQHQGFAPGPDPTTGGTYQIYNHHCYYKGQSAPHHTGKLPAPTRMAKRDPLDDLVIGAMLGI